MGVLYTCRLRSVTHRQILYIIYYIILLFKYRVIIYKFANLVMQDWLLLWTIHVIVYWLMVLLHGDTSRPDFKTAILASIKNQIFYSLPAFYVFFHGFGNYSMGYTAYETNQGFIKSLLYIPVLAICTDIYFHIVHRLCHTKLLWPIHRKHHDAPVHVAKALDADIFDHIIVNLGSATVGVWFLQYYGIILDVNCLHVWAAAASYFNSRDHVMKTPDTSHVRHH